MDLYHINRLSIKDLTDTSAFQVHGYTAFNQARAPLLIACQSKPRPNDSSEPEPIHSPEAEFNCEQDVLSEHQGLPTVLSRQHRWRASCLSRSRAGAAAKSAQDHLVEQIAGTMPSGL